MVEITVILQAVQTVGILMGIFYYIMTIRTNQKNQEISLKTQELTLESQELTRKAQEQALETRQAQLFMHIYRDFTTPDFIKRYFDIRNSSTQTLEEYQEAYGDLRQTDLERYSEWISVGTYYEGIGTLVKFGLIDPIMVYEMMGGMVFGYWNSRGMNIKEQMKVEPSYGKYIEYLHQEMVKIAKERDPERDPYS